MELASCHLSGTENFEVALRYLEDLYTPGLKFTVFHLHKDSIPASCTVLLIGWLLLQHILPEGGLFNQTKTRQNHQINNMIQQVVIDSLRI